ELAKLAADRGLPLVIMRRLVDDRLTPVWLKCRAQRLDEVRQFVDTHSKQKIVLSHFSIGELDELKNLRSQRNLFFEIGSFSPGVFWYEETINKASQNQWIHGSGAPLFYHLGAR